MSNMKKMRNLVMAAALGAALALTGCSTAAVKQRAKEAAAKHWTDKAYPGKGYDVQVMSAEKADGGLWKVTGVVDGEKREGTYNPETDSFSEGFYPMAKEKSRRIAELEEEVKYLKDKVEDLERQNYKLKVKLGIDDKKSLPSSGE